MGARTGPARLGKSGERAADDLPPCGHRRGYRRLGSRYRRTKPVTAEERLRELVFGKTAILNRLMAAFGMDYAIPSGKAVPLELDDLWAEWEKIARLAQWDVRDFGSLLTPSSTWTLHDLTGWNRSSKSDEWVFSKEGFDIIVKMVVDNSPSTLIVTLPYGGVRNLPFEIRDDRKSLHSFFKLWNAALAGLEPPLDEKHQFKLMPFVADAAFVSREPPDVWLRKRCLEWRMIGGGEVRAGACRGG